MKIFSANVEKFFGRFQKKKLWRMYYLKNKFKNFWDNFETPRLLKNSERIIAPIWGYLWKRFKNSDKILEKKC